MLVLNAIVGFLQEKQAGDAIKELTKELALKAKVKRNGEIVEIDATGKCKHTFYLKAREINRITIKMV